MSIYFLQDVLIAKHIDYCYSSNMKFKALQDYLRKTLRSRIAGGELSGLRLAEQTGFQQAHISNFLNRKRGLSVEGMDKVLSVQHLSVLDLLDPSEVNKRASILPPSEGDFENVLLVDGAVAATEPLVTSKDVKDVLKFKKGFLRRLRSDPEGGRSRWERFVVLKADAREGMSMYPRLLPGATVLVDRHYNSLQPYRKGESNMYAVNQNGNAIMKYAELASKHLVLRPHNPAYPVEVMAIEEGKRSADYIIGRICYVGMET